MHLQRAAVIVMCSFAVLAAYALDEAGVRAMEEKCEQAREARLKPLREAEIENCKAQKRNDPGYCERFWRDYGNAVRVANGRMKPRLFHDLPECIAAREARRELRLNPN